MNAERVAPISRSTLGRISTILPPRQPSPYARTAAPHVEGETFNHQARFPQIAPDTIIDRFRIMERVGEGGMGTVYRAWHPEHGDSVLKFSGADDNRRRILVTEGRRMAGLAAQPGSHVPPVFHQGTIEQEDGGVIFGHEFYAAPYIAGQTVRALLNNQRPLPLRQALDIAIQVCYSVRGGHRAGVLHNDIKPENIMVDNQGKVWVMDWGAHLIFPVAPDTRRSMTPTHAAPENWRGGELFPRADVFSVGVLLWEMLTGSYPYKGEPLEMARQLWTQGLPPLPPLFPWQEDHPLQAIVSKMAALEPEARYQSLDEVISDLEGVREQDG